jgi:hypothetical protein
MICKICAEESRLRDFYQEQLRSVVIKERGELIRPLSYVSDFLYYNQCIF